MRHIGILTTDRDLVVRSWDEVLARMTRVPADVASGQSLEQLAPEAASRGVLTLLRETLASGTVTVLAPAIHHYLIACAPEEESAEFDRMQQRVSVSPLSNEQGTVGLVISVEDVTARLEAERRLARELRHPDPAVRRAAIERAEKSGATAVQPLGAALADEDWQVRRAAVGALGTRRDPELLQALVTALRDGHHDFSLLSSALRLLSLTGLDAAEALVTLMRSDDGDLRIQAALALGTQTGPHVVVALLSALEDPDRNVRFHAIESLGKLRAHAAVPRLGALAASGDFFLAFPAIEALARIGDASAVVHIVPALDDPALRHASAEALGALGDEDAIGPLLATLAHPGSAVGPIVSAIAAIHARYDETTGGGGRIEDLVRRLLTEQEAGKVVDFVRGATGPELRSALVVLSWTRLPSVVPALTKLLAQNVVPHDVIETLVRFGSPMLEALLAQLQKGDDDTRRAAAVALGRLGDRAAVPALIDALDDAEPPLLTAVAGALARLGDERAFEPLLARLGDSDPAVRQATIGAINSIGHPQTAARVVDLLRDENPFVRQSAAKIAGYFGYEASADALVACGTDPDERVRAAALEHVPFIDDARVLPLLVNAVQHDSPRCRAAAASALGHVAGPEPFQALLGALKDQDAWVRYFAANSLGRHCEPAAVDALAAVAERDTAGQVRIGAIDALGAIGGERALVALERLAAATEPDVAAAALRAVGCVRVPEVSGLLRRALRSDDAVRRAAAASGLAAFGGPEAIEALLWTASADDDPAVVSAALGGLASLASNNGDMADAVQALARAAADPGRRRQAMPVLVKIPLAAVPTLGLVLRHADPSVRAVAVEALERIARPPASSLLVEALDDPDPAVRSRAVDALSRLGTRGVVRRIARLAGTDESPDVRRAAETALARAGGAGAEGEP